MIPLKRMQSDTKSQAAISIDDDFIKHFIALVSLHNNIPKKGEHHVVGQCFVEDYLDLLKYFSGKTVRDLRMFLIPESGILYGGACDGDMLAAKVSGMVTYLRSLFPPEEEIKIGFKLERL